MKRFLAITALIFAPLMIQAQTVTVHMDVTMTLQNMMDLHQHWLSQASQQLGVLASDVDATTTSVSITIDTSQLSAAPPTFSVGQSVLLATNNGIGEPCQISSITGGVDNVPKTITCTRNQYVPSPMVIHTAGSVIYLMKYNTPYEMLAEEALQPYSQQVVHDLGPKSQTFSHSISGSVTVNQ